ncbi:hypothetical protein [Mucilaginibacter aquariorum]|uniref:SH3 domain-containing protein n=1 Tax=Mucilaginibacter aquariorum TaxID=2967225 RepID=A0ABT1T5V1_9SPHI|nr:hypothetical protein [Mucilaginibacter aquariorum]MCQ6959944.1 hypothetical protein [Mucilaginibacter aquariorum]
MKGLNSFINLPNFSSEINRNLGITSSLVSMINAQQNFQRHLQPFYNLQNQLPKTYGIQDMIRAGEMAAIQGVAKSVIWQSRFQLPTATISALTLIQKQQKQFYNHSKSFIQLTRSHIAAAQISNLHIALNGISSSIARSAATQQDWDLIDEFEDINQIAIELTDNSNSDQALTEEESIAIGMLIERISAFVNRNKKFAKYSWSFIQIIIAIMALHQYADFLKPKPHYATNTDIARFEHKITKDILDRLKAQKEFRITNHLCVVKLKPKHQSISLAILPKNCDVVVLQFKHKWVYVSFVDATDNSPQTGWVLKKYLRKP